MPILEGRGLVVVVVEDMVIDLVQEIDVEGGLVVWLGLLMIKAMRIVLRWSYTVLLYVLPRPRIQGVRCTSSFAACDLKHKVSCKVRPERAGY